MRLSVVTLIAIPGHDLAKEFQPLLPEFLKRFTDSSVEVRLAAVKYAKECILSNPFRPESSGIIGEQKSYIFSFSFVLYEHFSDQYCYEFQLY